MRFIYFSLIAYVTLAVAFPELKDRVSLSGGSVEARGPAPAAVNERRQVDWFYDEDDISNDYRGSNTMVPDHVAKRRGLRPADPKGKRQFDWFYDDEDWYDWDWYDEYLGDYDSWVSENTAKRRGLPPADSKDKRQVDWLYDDEDDYYDDWVGDFNSGVSDNAAKAKA